MATPEPLRFSIEIDPRLLKTLEALYFEHLKQKGEKEAFLPSLLEAMGKIAEMYLSTKGGGKSMEEDEDEEVEGSIPYDQWFASFCEMMQHAQGEEAQEKLLEDFFGHGKAVERREDENRVVDGLPCRLTTITFDFDGIDHIVYIVFRPGLSLIISETYPIIEDGNGNVTFGNLR